MSIKLFWSTLSISWEEDDVQTLLHQSADHSARLLIYKCFDGEIQTENSKERREI